MPFEFKKKDIPDVIYVEPKLFQDDRGYFAEIYKSREFAQNGIAETFTQMNHSKSQKNVLRGLHYQKEPAAQGKLLGVLSGEIFDVAVDIRKGSPSYGQWVGTVLNSQKKDMVFIPAGFAHGFCVLSETVEIFYYCTKEYDAEQERGIIWNDPELAIAWPVKDPILSGKDQAYPLLRDAENNFQYQE